MTISYFKIKKKLVDLFMKRLAMSDFIHWKENFDVKTSNNKDIAGDGKTENYVEKRQPFSIMETSLSQREC